MLAFKGNQQYRREATGFHCKKVFTRRVVLPHA